MAQKAFFRLKDTGSSFHDISQQAGVVVDKIAPLELTSKVLQAERDGQLIRVDKTEGAKQYRKQLKDEADQAGKKADNVDDEGNVIVSSTTDNEAMLDRGTGIVGGDGSNVAKSAELTDEDVAPEPKTKPKK